MELQDQVSRFRSQTLTISHLFRELPLRFQIPFITIVFFLLAVGGIILTREAGRIAWIWLPNAVLLALVVEAGLSRQAKLIAAGFAGNLMANLSVGDSVLNAVALSSFNTIEIVICIVCLERICKRIDLAKPTHLMKFSAIAGGVAPAVVGVMASAYLHFSFGTSFVPVFVNWYGADALGMLLIAPFLLAGIPREHKDLETESIFAPKSIAALLICVAIALAVFVQSTYTLLFLVMLPVAFVAFMAGILCSAIAVIAIALIATSATILGYGPIALMQNDLPSKVLVLQIFLVSCSLFGLAISAVLTQKRLLEQERISLTKSAQAANRAKSEFLATVNHELRTPLTSMRGALGLMEQGVGGKLPENASRLLELTQHNCDRLMLLVNDILEVEKIESGKFVMSLETKAARKTLEEATFSYVAYLPEKEVSITLVDRTPNALLEIDENRLQQAIANLVSNAIKFSPVDGIVEIRSQLVGDSVRISVLDEGPGIPESFTDKVFQKFEQVETGDARSVSGTGLGLSISKALVELMNGSISFRAREGQGTEFFIDLPLAAPVAEPVEIKKLLLLNSDHRSARAMSDLAMAGGWFVDFATSYRGFARLLETDAYDALVIGESFATTEELQRMWEKRDDAAQTQMMLHYDEAERFFEIDNSSRQEESMARSA